MSTVTKEQQKEVETNFGKWLRDKPTSIHIEDVMNTIIQLEKLGYTISRMEKLVKKKLEIAEIH